MDSTAAVGAEIRRRRRAQGRTLRQLASSAGIDFGYLGKIERGSAASTATLEDVASALGTDIADLFAGAKRRVRRAPPARAVQHPPQRPE